MVLDSGLLFGPPCIFTNFCSPAVYMGW